MNKRQALIDYMLMKVREGDWHAVSDAANDIRVLEERERSRESTKIVWQWRFKNAEQKHWKVAKSLLTSREAHDYFIGCDIAEHAGPFEVPL